MAKLSEYLFNSPTGEALRGLAIPEFTQEFKDSSAYFVLTSQGENDPAWNIIDTPSGYRYHVPEGTASDDRDQASHVLDSQLLLVFGSGVNIIDYIVLPNAGLYRAGLRRTIYAADLSSPTITLDLAVSNIKAADGASLASITFVNDQFLIVEGWDDSGDWRVVRGTATVTAV